MPRPLSMLFLALLVPGPLAIAQESANETAPERTEQRARSPRLDTTLLAPERPRLGLIVAPVDAQLRGHLKLEDGGLYVVEVVEGSPADQASIETGDIVLRAGDRDLQQPGDLADQVRSAQGESLRLMIQRTENVGGGPPVATRRIVTVELPQSPDDTGFGEEGERAEGQAAEGDAGRERDRTGSLTELLRQQIDQLADQLGSEFDAEFSEEDMRQLRRLTERLLDEGLLRDRQPEREEAGEGTERERPSERERLRDRERRFELDLPRLRREEGPRGEGRLPERLEQLQRELQELREEMRRMQRDSRGGSPAERAPETDRPENGAPEGEQPEVRRSDEVRPS